MTRQTFKLGDMDFTKVDFAVPSGLQSGFETGGTLHTLPQSDGTGAKRILITTGVYHEETMSYNALFRGDDALGNYNRLVSMQYQRQSIQLQDGAELWDVVIKKVHKTKAHRREQYFQIDMWVMSNHGGAIPSSSIPYVSVPQTLKTQSDKITNITQDSYLTADARAAALQQAAAAGAPQLAAVTPNSTTSDLLAAATTAQNMLATAQTLLGLVTNSGDALSLNTYQSASAAVGSLTSYLKTIYSLTGQDGSGALQISSGDCYTLAAVYLGDWMRFGDIMDVNGLSDPFITVPTTVLVPKN